MKYLFLFITLLMIPSGLSAQTETVAVPKGISLTFNKGEGENAVYLDIQLEMKESDAINFDYWLNNPSEMPVFSLQYADQKLDCPLTVKRQLSGNAVGFKITGFTPSTFDRFLNKDHDNQITIRVDKDVRINLFDERGNPSRIWIIKADIINTLINEELKITEDERTDFLTSLNNFYYHENKVDFGVNPGRDSIKTNYILSLRFQNAYNRKRFLSCNENTKRMPVYWNLDARLSTNFKDSLNYIKIYPANFLFENFSGKLPYQLSVKLGNESDQSFINKRVAADASVNMIVPNLINLTTAESNRLRLKPVITAGIKGYYDYSNDITSFTSGMAHIDGYYYIPVFNNYAIIVEATSFYDFSKERNPSGKIQGNYSITLGAEIPKTGFKAMFKYTDGKSDINFRQGSIISIGLLMDFFQEKKNKPK
ncbi:hypothetical protein QX233_16630 [Chryseobacterium gambrini]|uniref:Uncharacterized protein n=1 Tax=Chryseobacterium gambrini TaxID=373672 RepID=A0AAJ1R5L4_9FLAO|nr:MULTISPECIES: hypothetical protein [Chryseobacterium]MDN4014098.1 hypothetical protein [Chryseobacterium gambrini]MDN4028153.1 hypothetical protein [Chryseobacterium gambrini]QWA39865.1 hypothetical protein KKI44_06555 [Chryseobacterium sp. ZHDP1]